MEPHLELDELRSFIAVAERGSVLGAADSLHTTRGRVRRHIDNLEAVMGVSLLSRTREGVELTPQGTLLLERAKTLVGSAHQLVREFQQLSGEPQSVIRVGLQVGYPREIALAINQFLGTHLQQSQRINRVAERPVELLPDKVDLVICLGDQTPPVPCLDFEVARIAQRVFARKDYIEKWGQPTLEEIEKSLLGSWLGPDEDGHDLHLTAGGTHRVRPMLLTSDEQYLKLLALRQDGFVYAPLPETPLDVEMARLQSVRTDLIGRSIRGRVLIAERLANTRQFQSVLETLRNFMKDTGVKAV